MNATRILWGQVIAVISVTLLGIWSATQWTAHALAYQPELGQPWFWLEPWPIYPPYAFFWWWFSFDAYAPRIFLNVGGRAVRPAQPGIDTVTTLDSRAGCTSSCFWKVPASQVSMSPTPP